ncbi:MAG: TatD family hydrolase [Actinobacteria bacterium]|nr:TatD family hydrolase [Actinomycetota bacterium]
MSDQNPELAVQAGAVDTHCHLFLLDRQPPEVVEAARAAGVGRMICVGVDVATSRRSLELADSLGGVFATAGLHPHDASTFDHRMGAELEEMVHDPRCVGVGETGLDHFRMQSPTQDQERAFALHIELARDSGKALVVHVRDAWPDALRVLQEGSAERVVIHCFSGDADVARECLARGYYLSFAGNVTYPKNDHLRAAARVAPLDRLLVETDSPFLSPQSRRGSDNEPANVTITLREVAAERGETFETLRHATTANAFDLFEGLQ